MCINKYSMVFETFHNIFSKPFAQWFMKLSVQNLLKSSQREPASAFGSIYPHIFELCSALCLHLALFDRQCVAPPIRHCSHKMLRIHRSICGNKKLFRCEIRINSQGNLRCCIERNTFKEMLISENHLKILNRKFESIKIPCFRHLTLNCCVRKFVVYPNFATEVFAIIFYSR